MGDLKVLAFTQGLGAPPARFRVRQYSGILSAHGVQVRESAAALGSYPPLTRALRPAWGAGALVERSLAALGSWGADLSWIQREMISTMFTAERLTKAPRVLDVDDAIWLSAGVPVARRLAQLCERVVCGNDFLADAFSRWNQKVAVLPTAVDVERFRPYPERRTPGLIGWSGSSSGLRYLQQIEAPLARVLAARPGARLRVVCDRPPSLPGIPPERIEFVRWTPAVEVRTLQELAVGLMPLGDTDWERGKCSYKMLLYAACGVPSVVSPVGMNRDLLAMGRFAMGPESMDEWVDALLALLDDPEDATRRGEEGRAVIVTRFSTSVVGARLAGELHSAAGLSRPSAPPEPVAGSGHWRRSPRHD